ncbi:DUF192 domain-containing protein [uncultured Hoeflea sp.]|uniref:DUF192 domain-containing protein n=1 Tax=uncultured Hoeflea sp. TaxID=538666 RepID=UPI00260CC030|nr:DUF192 domain-containing protein [uncultured Hoeflea sp.]
MILQYVALLSISAGVAAAAMVLPVDQERLVVETGAGPVNFSVELALTAADRSNGLMHRQDMAADHGMLFRFDRTRQVMMWMKNTPLPLDMLFISADGVVAGIAANTVPFSQAIIASPGPVRYVLELNAGTAKRTGIAVGDRVRHRVIGSEGK